MYYPLFVEMEEKRCLFAGGGRVALRKAQVLKRFGARIRVIAPEVLGEFEEIADDIKRRPFCDEDIAGADIVVAATDDRRLNRHIAELCKSCRIPVNAGRDGSVFFGAVFENGEAVAAVSTNGKDPAGAVRMRDELRRMMEGEIF